MVIPGEHKEKSMNPSIKIIPFPNIANAYVVISARISETANGCKKNMSFLYDNGNGIAVEWEPDNGPITILHACNLEDEGAQPHWFFKYYTGQGHWSQLAVIEEELPQDFLNGNYESLFSTLRSWAK